MTKEVITFTPTRQVITFDNYEAATQALLPKYHDRIIKSWEDLYHRYDLQSMRWMITLSMGLKSQGYGSSCPVDQLLKITNRQELSTKLWPMLVTHGRRTKHVALNKKVANPGGEQGVSYSSNYEPGVDEVRDLLYIRRPPQARVVIDMITEKVVPAGDLGVPEYKFYKWMYELREEGKLITKQDPWYIFTFYKKVLETDGFIVVSRNQKRKVIK